MKAYSVVVVYQKDPLTKHGTIKLRRSPNIAIQFYNRFSCTFNVMI